MYRIVNIGGYDLGQQQAPPSELQTPTQPTKTSAGSPATYGCPFTPPPAPGSAAAAFAVITDPTLNCMRDARGNAVCSDGSHYPPGCPHTPPDSVFTPGITPDVTTNGRIEGQIPAPRGGAAPAEAPGVAAAPSSGPSPALMIGAGALGAGLLATGAYFLFLK